MAKKTERVPAPPAKKPSIVELIAEAKHAKGAELTAVCNMIQRQVVDLLLTGEALVREAELAAQREGGNRDPSHNTAVRAAIAAQHAARYGDHG